MTDKSNFKLHPDFEKRLRATIEAAEGDSVISIPKSGDSGVSIGPLQLDLAKQKDFRNALIALGQQHDKTAKDAAGDKPFTPIIPVDAEALLQTKNSEKDDAKKGRAEELAKKLMALPGATELLNNAEGKQLNDVKDAVVRNCRQAGKDAQAFCGSLQGQLELAAHVHQFGAKSTEKLETYLRGEQTELNNGKNKVKIEGPLSVERFREEFRNKTLWAENAAPGNQGRHKKLDDHYLKNGIDDGSKAKLNPPAPPPPIPVPRDTAPKLDAATPEKHSALPEDEADAPVQSAEATPAAPASEDENRFIVGWTTQPDMTSRPIWGNEAQYDAYKAQQADAEAGASAANDPEPAMPQSASLQQPAPEQNTNLLEAASYLPDGKSSRGPKVWNPDSGALADAVMQAGRAAPVCRSGRRCCWGATR